MARCVFFGFTMLTFGRVNVVRNSHIVDETTVAGFLTFLRVGRKQRKRAMPQLRR